MKVVRDSKFRHVFAEVRKEKFEDLRVASKANESNGVRGNPKFIAFPWESGGGGSLAVMLASKTGRTPRDIPLVAGHTGAILDFEFNPFDDNMILTASEDMTMKLWQIPDEGLKAHLKEPLVSLEGHSKKLSFCNFNPTANGIVASTAFDFTTRVWNIEEQDQAFSIEMPEQVMHMKWNYAGSLLGTCCKDKRMRIIDPRTSSFVAQFKIHEGVKPSKVEWMGSASATDECYKFITTGFSTQAERQVSIWDLRKLQQDQDNPEPLNMLTLDQGTGCLYPFFDCEAQMLYVAGKGDANVRYFEADVADPFLHFINDFRTTVPQKGFDFMPKRCVDTTKHEIARGVKLESGSVSIVSFKVPRKSDLFQEDLYPEAFSGEPSLTADQWVGGAECRGRNVVDMQKLVANSGEKKSKTPAMKVVSVKELKAELAEAKAKIQALEKENEALKVELADLKK